MRGTHTGLSGTFVTVGQLTDRLLGEHPTMTAVEAVQLAESIVRMSERMVFQLSVERDLAALPTTRRGK